MSGYAQVSGPIVVTIAMLGKWMLARWLIMASLALIASRLRGLWGRII